MKTSKIGYLISQHTISHTFVLREIIGMRAAGFDIRSVSVRRPDRPISQMPPVEAEEVGRTDVLLATPALRMAGILLRQFLRRPGPFLSGLATALAASEGAPKQVLYYLAYFAEAVLAGDIFERAGITHFHTHFASTIGWLLTRVFPITMSATLHGSAEFIEPRSFHLREKIEASRFVVGISNFGMSQMMLATRYPFWSRLELVRLGIDTSAYEFTPRVVSSGEFRMVTVGRLAEAKGLPLLLEALARLLARGIPAHLDIVGDGPLRTTLANRAAELGVTHAVTFHGAQPQEKVRDFYRSADVCVLASFIEGIPVVLMEAMALGTPVVATRVTGVPELVEDGKNGLLAIPGDIESLLEALETVARYPDLQEAFSRAGRSTVEAKFNLGTNLSQLAAVFEKRLSG